MLIVLKDDCPPDPNNKGKQKKKKKKNLRDVTRLELVEEPPVVQGLKEEDIFGRKVSADGFSDTEILNMANTDSDSNAEQSDLKLQKPSPSSVCKVETDEEEQESNDAKIDKEEPLESTIAVGGRDSCCNCCKCCNHTFEFKTKRVPEVNPNMGTEVVFAETGSSLLQVIKINSCPVHSAGDFCEMAFRLQFTETGGYFLVPDDTIQMASADFEAPESMDANELEILVSRARNRLNNEPLPIRYLVCRKWGQSKEAESEPLDIGEMSAYTRHQGLTRFEVGIVTKEIRYNNRFLEIQDEHKTPGIIHTENDYGDANLQIELNIVKNPDERNPVDEHLSKALELKLVVEKVELNAEKRASMEKTCQVCQEPAPMKCKGCLKVGYCSKEHQKEHWKSHKKKCVPYEMKTDDKYGRHLVARCEIQPRSLIFRESPLVTGPTMGDHIVGNVVFDVEGLVRKEDEPAVKNEMGLFTLKESVHLSGNFYAPICLGCDIELRQHPIHPADEPVPVCPKCEWPLCSPSCSMLENHEMECEYFRKNGIVYMEVYNHYLIVPRVFIVLRCLLLQEKNPEVWKTITNLESNSQLRADTEKKNGYRLHDLYIVRMLKSGFKVEADPESIRTIIDIIDCNAFYVARMMCEKNKYRDSMKRVAGLFDKASFLSHSCIPNAIAIMSPYDHKMEVIAGRKIHKGEPICIDYDHTGNLRPKNEHREFLQNNYFFNCTCPMCADPTEDELFFNGITCTKCKRRGREGVVCPTDPYDEECLWKCRRCGYERSASSIANVYGDAKKMLSTPSGGYTVVLERVRNSILTKFNTAVLEAEFATTQVFMNEDFQAVCKVDDEMLYFLRTACIKRLHLLEMFYPSIDKRIVNCRLALCSVAVLESMHFAEMDKVKVCIDSCSQVLLELSSLFVGVEEFFQLHAFLLRSLRIGTARLQHMLLKRAEMYQLYRQFMSEKITQLKLEEEHSEEKSAEVKKENPKALKRRKKSTK